MRGRPRPLPPRWRESLAAILVVGVVMAMASALAGPPAPFAPGAPLPLNSLFSQRSAGAAITADPTAGSSLTNIMALVIMAGLGGALWLTIRQRVVRAVVAILLVIMGIMLLAGPAISGGAEPSAAPAPPAASVPATAASAVPAPPPWLAIAISTGVLLITALVLGKAARRRPPAPATDPAPPDTALAELAQEARSTISAIEAGADLRTSIVRCYLEMSRVLDTQHGIVRDAGMTSREFARRLAGLGMQTTHTQALTDLFERYRYSLQVPTAGDADYAVQCLAAIAQSRRGEP